MGKIAIFDHFWPRLKRPQNRQNVGNYNLFVYKPIWLGVSAWTPERFCELHAETPMQFGLQTKKLYFPTFCLFWAILAMVRMAKKRPNIAILPILPISRKIQLLRLWTIFPHKFRVHGPTTNKYPERFPGFYNDFKGSKCPPHKLARLDFAHCMIGLYSMQFVARSIGS